MSTSQSNAAALDIFKRVYGDKVTDFLPQDFYLAQAIPFSQKQRVGDSYYEAAILTNESGITFGGNTTDSFELNPAIAGVVKQCSVSSYISVLPSIIPWGVMSRSVGGGDRAFFDATKFLVKNNLRSHGRFQEIIRLYGQSSKLLGYVSYASQVYRGVSFTNGTGTLNGIAFTNGINASGKYILLAPGNFAAGIWVGMEGVRVNQVDSTGAIVASGNLVAVQADYGYLQVNFTPVAASSTTSHRLCFAGMEQNRDYIGIHKICSTQSGTLFSINVAQYSLWQPNIVNLAQDVSTGTLFTLPKLQDGVAAAVNKAGLEGDLEVLVNPRSWAKLANTEAGLRLYDESYRPQQAEQGFESIKFWTQAGICTIRPHRCVMEGDAFALYLPAWSRSGSSEVSFTVPGMDDRLIYPLENQAGYAFRSFSDQYLFCNMPSWQIYFQNINDEATS